MFFIRPSSSPYGSLRHTVLHIIQFKKKPSLTCLAIAAGTPPTLCRWEHISGIIQGTGYTSLSLLDNMTVRGLACGETQGRDFLTPQMIHSITNGSIVPQCTPALSSFCPPIAEAAPAPFPVEVRRGVSATDQRETEDVELRQTNLTRRDSRGNDGYELGVTLIRRVISSKPQLYRSRACNRNISAGLVCSAASAFWFHNLFRLKALARTLNTLDCHTTKEVFSTAFKRSETATICLRVTPGKTNIGMGNRNIFR